MFAKLENGMAYCIADYKDIKAGASVPVVNELYVQVLECVDANGWQDLPIEQTQAYKASKQQEEQERAEALTYLDSTDWIVAKISEALALGKDTSPLLTKYSTELDERASMRELIDNTETAQG